MGSYLSNEGNSNNEENTQEEDCKLNKRCRAGNASITEEYCEEVQTETEAESNCICSISYLLSAVLDHCP